MQEYNQQDSQQEKLEAVKCIPTARKNLQLVQPAAAFSAVDPEECSLWSVESYGAVGDGFGKEFSEHEMS